MKLYSGNKNASSSENESSCCSSDSNSSENFQHNIKPKYGNYDIMIKPKSKEVLKFSNNNKNKKLVIKAKSKKIYNIKTNKLIKHRKNL